MRPAKIFIPAALAAAISVFSATCVATAIHNGELSLRKGWPVFHFAKPW